MNKCLLRIIFDEHCISLLSLSLNATKSSLQLGLLLLVHAIAPIESTSLSLHVMQTVSIKCCATLHINSLKQRLLLPIRWLLLSPIIQHIVSSNGSIKRAWVYHSRRLLLS